LRNSDVHSVGHGRKSSREECIFALGPRRQRKVRKKSPELRRFYALHRPNASSTGIACRFHSRPGDNQPKHDEHLGPSGRMQLNVQENPGQATSLSTYLGMQWTGLQTQFGDGLFFGSCGRGREASNPGKRYDRNHFRVGREMPFIFADIRDLLQRSNVGKSGIRTKPPGRRCAGPRGNLDAVAVIRLGNFVLSWPPS